MAVRVTLLALFVALAGCSGFDLKQLAPPGIIRYEKIADEKEANPAITAEIEQFQQDEKARYPKIGETPAAQISKGSIPERAVDEAAALATARNMLDSSVAEDVAGVEADRAGADVLSGAADALAAEIDDDAAKAESEKRAYEDLTTGE